MGFDCVSRTCRFVCACSTRVTVLMFVHLVEVRAHLFEQTQHSRLASPAFVVRVRVHDVVQCCCRTLAHRSTSARATQQTAVAVGTVQELDEEWQATYNRLSHDANSSECRHGRRRH